jgi:crossover junction endodeoxyribonuclease RusA
MKQEKHVKERWTLEDDERPWTMNSERSWHWSKRAMRTKSTREKFYWLSKIEQVPKLEYISVDVVPLYKTKGPHADTGAHFPTAKAAIDGIVDAGVIPDDSGKHIQKITFWSPTQNGKDGMRVVITNRAKEKE